MASGTTLRVYLKAISPSGSLLLLLLLHFQGGIITTASAAATATEQKCDKVVSLETQEKLSYLGNVTFTVPTAFKGRWTTTIKFTSPYTFIGGWGVEVQSYGRKAYAVFQRNFNETLRPGNKVIFQFRVLYGLNVKVPKVLSIKWENKIICGPPILVSPEIPMLETSSQESESDDEDDRVEQFQQHVPTNNFGRVWKSAARKE